MSIPPSHPNTPSHRWKPLDPQQRRVLGVLIEKAKTTPAGYPMTVNAIVTGCNQKNNREPVTAYDDVDVENALRDLCAMSVVSEIDWMGRSAKYKHHAYDWLGVSKAELAVLAELLLRGAQTLGDLRARAARMEPIADLAALEPIVKALLDRGLVVELTPPGRGQMVSHGLYPPRELADLRTRLTGAVHATPAPASEPRAFAPSTPASPTAADATASAMAAMVAEITALRDEVVRLRERVEVLEQLAEGR